MSIRTWLDPYPQQFRSTSNDIGYTRVVYANGIYVAVGHQKGFQPFQNNATAGDPVTCAGCSWSPDGETWTDARLPFAGTSTWYQGVAFNGVDKWMAASNEWIGTTSRRASLAVSTDNAKTWVADPAGRSNGVSNNVVGGAGRFYSVGYEFPSMTAGALATITGFQAGSTWVPSGTRELLAGAQQVPNNWFLFFAVNAPRANNVALNTWATFTANYTNLTTTSAMRGARECVHIPVTAPLFAASGDSSRWWILVEDSPPNDPNKRARNIWSTTESGGGGTWTLKATLPPARGNGDYSGFAASNNFLMATGDGICLVSRDGRNWKEVSLPAGRWTDAASDGKDFVVVSANGDRLKISGVSLEGRVS